MSEPLPFVQSVNELWWWGFFWSKSNRDQQTICAPYLSKVNSLFLQVLLNLKYCYILLQLVQIRLLKAAQPPTHWNAHTRNSFTQTKTDGTNGTYPCKIQASCLCNTSFMR